MDQRKEQILKRIIDYYIETGEPVASGSLSDFFSWSSATIRNEMAILEKGLYIYQPHISAGRVPTSDGYRYYIKNLIDEHILSKKTKNLLNAFAGGNVSFSELVRNIAVISQTMVLYSDGTEYIHYTGLSQLFAQPEFYNPKVVCRLSERLDNADILARTIEKRFKGTIKDLYIYIGKDNPVHDACSLLATTYKVNKNKNGIIALIGPMRMRYSRNVAILNSLNNILNS